MSWLVGAIFFLISSVIKFWLLGSLVSFTILALLLLFASAMYWRDFLKSLPGGHLTDNWIIPSGAKDIKIGKKIWANGQIHFDYKYTTKDGFKVAGSSSTTNPFSHLLEEFIMIFVVSIQTSWLGIFICVLGPIM